MRRTATISDCGLYRYCLTRRWADSHTVTFLMLNPSTADADVDDPTIRRCIGFARSWDYGGIRVLNLYALRATDPADLFVSSDPIGPENDMHIWRASYQNVYTGEPLIAAWGVNASDDRVKRVREIVSVSGATLTSLGVTKHGHPSHPLYLPKSSELAVWPRESQATEGTAHG